MKPQHRDQSKRVRWQNSNNWTTVFPSSSKDCRFYSVKIVHIKQPETKSQISELCFPSQWYRQNNKSTTELGMTQSIPNNWSIYIHKEWAIGQIDFEAHFDWLGNRSISKIRQGCFKRYGTSKFLKYIKSKSLFFFSKIVKIVFLEKKKWTYWYSPGHIWRTKQLLHIGANSMTQLHNCTHANNWQSLRTRLH